MTDGALRSGKLARVAIVMIVACVAASCGSAEPSARELRFVIPEGTAGLVATNRAPEIFPPKLTVHVGDSITVVNEDNFDQDIGPYRVTANSTMTQHFSSPGVLEGACSTSGTGSLTVTILPRT